MMILKQVLHVQSGTGSKYLEYNPGSELNIFLMNNEQKNQMKTKVEQKINKKLNNNKISEQQNRIIHNITGT
jgi:hypothetical protein